MADCDINTPPGQDSPKNILNILNNDCLQAIFRKLNGVRDIYSVAHVCTRFQQIAIECSTIEKLQIRYETPTETKTNNNQVLFLNNEENDVCAKRFLELFGSRIKSIQCDFTTLLSSIKHEDEDGTLDLISLHCRKTLNELRLKGENGKYDYELRLPFQALRTLSLEYTRFGNKNLAPMFQVKTMKMMTVKTMEMMNLINW